MDFTASIRITADITPPVAKINVNASDEGKVQYSPAIKNRDADEAIITPAKTGPVIPPMLILLCKSPVAPAVLLGGTTFIIFNK